VPAYAGTVVKLRKEAYFFLAGAFLALAFFAAFFFAAIVRVSMSG
jgi:hypothetical protein